MLQQLIAGILRHILTVLGGSLVTQGYLDGEQLTSGIGAILTLVGIGWSIWQKYKSRPKPADAVEVRRAIPVEPEAKFKLSPAAKRATSPNNKGFIEIGILFRLFLIVAVVSVFFLLCKLAVAEPALMETSGEHTRPRVSAPASSPAESLRRQPREWLVPVSEDQRPFLIRLITSPSLWAEAGSAEKYHFSYGTATQDMNIAVPDLAAGISWRADF